MIRAIIFDFNGVIADDEMPHILCFQQALSEIGLSLTAAEYYGTYLGMDERTCAAMLLTARDGSCDTAKLRQITVRKAELFRAYTTQHKPALFPGVVEFVKAARPEFRLAIASGGRREQIDQALSGTVIEQDFELIVSAEDCPAGKPDPAIYLLTLQRLNEGRGELPPLIPRECMVIEDSKAGIQSARNAGMWVLGLATTYHRDHLTEAGMVLPSLSGITPRNLCRSLEHSLRVSRSS
jgi:HAD superfamily hydrolase (TIGR01509 family)